MAVECLANIYIRVIAIMIFCSQTYDTRFQIVNFFLRYFFQEQHFLIGEYGLFPISLTVFKNTFLEADVLILEK